MRTRTDVDHVPWGVYYCAPASRVVGIKRWCASDVCLSRTSGLSREQAQEDKNWHRGSPRHTWLGHHFQGQKVKGRGHQASLVGVVLAGQHGHTVMVTYCVHDVYRVTTWRPGRGHIVAAARLQLVKRRPLSITAIDIQRVTPSVDNNYFAASKPPNPTRHCVTCGLLLPRLQSPVYSVTSSRRTLDGIPSGIINSTWHNPQ